MLYLSPSCAQLLLPEAGRTLQYTERFNPQVIAANKIKEIRCTIEIKKDGDRIRNMRRTYVYQFEPEGHTRLVSNIDHRLGDTSITVYTWAGGRLHCEVKNDAAGMFSYCYAYNKEGLPETRSYTRSPRASKLLAAQPSAEGTHIATERYEHARLENQLHSTLFNAANRPYIRQIRYYDPNGYLTGYTENFVMSSDRSEEQYAYNKKGLMSEREVLHPKYERTTWLYDEIGNPTEEKGFDQNGLELYRKEYIYEGKNMLLRAELKRVESEQYIQITNYQYKYW